MFKMMARCVVASLTLVRQGAAAQASTPVASPLVSCSPGRFCHYAGFKAAVSRDFSSPKLNLEHVSRVRVPIPAVNLVSQGSQRLPDDSCGMRGNLLICFEWAAPKIKEAVAHSFEAVAHSL